MTSIPKYISGEEILRRADLRAIVDSMRSAYTQELRGIHVPPRASIVRDEPFTAYDAMPAVSEAHGLFVTKIGAVVPRNAPGIPSVHALVVAFSASSGELLALLDGVAVTNVKCAAVTALVTDVCATPEARVLAVIGSGVQAREQIRGVTAVRPIKQVRVYSRDRRRLLDFTRDAAELCESAEFTACDSALAAVSGADILSTATTSVTPVITPDALHRPGLHINCFGNHTPDSRELPRTTLQESVLVVEDRDTAVLEAGEVHRNALTIPELLRRNATDLQRQRTVFASTGHALLDLLTVAALLEG